jgi:hypothetical protein
LMGRDKVARQGARSRRQERDHGNCSGHGSTGARSAPAASAPTVFMGICSTEFAIL